MASIYRKSRHPLVRWWWEMDTTSVFILIAIMLIGGIAVTTSSVAVAKTYGVSPYYFAIKQYIFLGLALLAMLSMPILRPTGVARISWILFVTALAGVAATLFMGDSVKGATRWVSVLGQTLQPSEFLKPALILVTAVLLSDDRASIRQRGFYISCIIVAGIGLLLLKQPDVGMLVLLSLVWFMQVFMAGVSMLWLLPLILIGVGMLGGAVFFFDHVRSRLERYFNPETNDTYQVDQAQEAILTGHLFGRGAGEGVVKHTLPDAHTDFIFAVIAEEFGIVLCLFLLGLYASLVIVGFKKIFSMQDRFSFLAAGGLLTMLAVQVMVNIGVALQLLPTTGMTLPFVSYGGSATLGTGLSMGFLLALLRKRRLK